MYEEERALSLLKRSVLVNGKDSLKRAPEYEVLKGGMTMFFRNGYGDVYETSSQGGFINGYSEEYLDEALELKKYGGQVMWKNDIQNFLDKEELIELRDEKGDITIKSEIITMTMAALGYSKEWLNEMFKPRLIEFLKNDKQLYKIS